MENLTQAADAWRLREVIAISPRSAGRPLTSAVPNAAPEHDRTRARAGNECWQCWTDRTQPVLCGAPSQRSPLRDTEPEEAHYFGFEKRFNFGKISREPARIGQPLKENQHGASANPAHRNLVYRHR